ncbi:N-acetylglucosaminidase [Macrococcus armenti]|uniref:N-acetylglucosaminidase n=1 Tax=Macrococcus armenti TaxID=2875764 RepID=UPI001CCBC4A7|nr:N-acetylglucosaminidase [Macrococcus armenti]UBH14752.1 N-acetylglucosaminidase [Macrococcus armenti]UBH17110.1 N-acetylglucosaminidase [Macrococcus armenti]UBH19376.1 N-acetylglucosaminidase [Macrococcus armenti]
MRIQKSEIIGIRIFSAVIAGFIILMAVEAINNAKFKDRHIKVNHTYKSALDKQMKAQAVHSNGIEWKSATRKQIDTYMNIEQLKKDKAQRYQFLNLSKTQKVHPKTLNKLLKGKGILSNHGTSFARASRLHDVNEIYLINHALLETAKGKSELARGVVVDDKGTVGKGNKKYYNFFGIGAYDHDPINEAAKYAYRQGWDTPEKAIVGGAYFIKKDFLSDVAQSTLYGMRFNPENPGQHQYATDVRWAHHNARTIAKDYKKLGLKGEYFTTYEYAK